VKPLELPGTNLGISEKKIMSLKHTLRTKISEAYTQP
jgi:hypothetical protein